MIYDYIIVGAGIGGIAAGLNLAKNKKNVLILEKNSLPGGLISTFKKGRFEFDTSIYDLYNYGNEEHTGLLKKYLDELQINLDAQIVPFNTRLKSIGEKVNYEIKGNPEDWLLVLEKINPNSIEPLRKYLRVIKEIHEAFDQLINTGNVEESEYPCFYKYLRMNVIDALSDLGVPKKTIHEFGYIWINLGSPLNKLSFIDFSEMMYKIFFKKNVILKESNLSFILKLVDKYEKLGGKIYYRSNVIKIDNKEDIKVVTLENGEKFKAQNIICDLSPRYVLKNLLEEEYPYLNKVENSRTIGFSSTIVYLGLNKSASELHLNNYKYYQFQSINSEKNISTMDDIDHRTIEAYVPNVVNPAASPKNTSILVLKTNYYGDIFRYDYDYPELKERLAKNLIKEFETSFGLDIEEYIEEIEITTPFTHIRSTNNPNGSIFGYMRLGYDNCVNRVLAYPKEKIKGISFVGGSSLFASGVDNAFLSGYFITNRLMEENV